MFTSEHNLLYNQASDESLSLLASPMHKYRQDVEEQKIELIETAIKRHSEMFGAIADMKLCLSHIRNFGFNFLIVNYFIFIFYAI
jgi:hypothetical protein